LKKSIKIYF